MDPMYSVMTSNCMQALGVGHYFNLTHSTKKEHACQLSSSCCSTVYDAKRLAILSSISDLSMDTMPIRTSPIRKILRLSHFARERNLNHNLQIKQKSARLEWRTCLHIMNITKTKYWRNSPAPFASIVQDAVIIERKMLTI